MRHEFASGKTIKSAEFDSEAGQIAVEFASGDRRAHGGFTAELWAEWLAADVAGQNAGSWYHSKIRQRPKVHPEIKLDQQPEPKPESREVRHGDGELVAVPIASRGARAKAKAALRRWNG